MGRPSKILTKEDILRAMKVTKSNMHAARHLHVSYNHYKKYAKMYKNDDGITLLDAHKNQQGKGIIKYSNKKLPQFKAILDGEVPSKYLDREEFKQRLIFEALIEEKCNKCNFSERRVKDTQVPLTINYKDGNKNNLTLANIEFLCLNCHFLYGVDTSKKKVRETLVDYVDHADQDREWQMDEHHMDHLKELGLYNEDSPGDEYISKL
tara:strand:- start:530 stop:1153 length:624 start_codon:yes stop_codon:yes gene_type:complete